MALVCYHGEIPHRINQDKADLILKVMTDSDNRKIIGSIKNESKTAIQISEETKVTISTVYRRLHELDEKKLVMLSGDINSERRKSLRYKSKIRKVVAVLDEDVYDVRVYSNLKDEIIFNNPIRTIK